MPAEARAIRPFSLCRSWMFVPGADEALLKQAASCGADVLIQELEDFTPPERREAARLLAKDTYDAWRGVGAIAAVRINPLSGDGHDDLAAAMEGRPDVVALPKVRHAGHILELDEAVSEHENRLGIAAGRTKLLPNVESAEGLVNTLAIATASERVIGCLLASEDLAADLGAERLPDCCELDYARQRFLIECRAASVIAVDCPFTWADTDGVVADAKRARRWGYRAKSAVSLGHAPLINTVFTPGSEDVDAAERIVATFEAAKAAESANVELEGSLLEVPTYTAAKRLLERAAAFRKFETG